MPTAPIIEIPVDDSAFEKFAAAFDDYSEKLKDMPADWQAMNNRIAELAKLQRAAGVASDAAWANAATAAMAYEKTVHGAAKAQKNLAATTTRSGNAMHRMATQAKAVRDHLFGAVQFLAKFSAYGVAGGLVGAGGLAFGLDDLAGHVLATQRTSRGYGLTTGQLNAYNAIMKPYAGSSALEAAANLKSGDLSLIQNPAIMGIGSINAQSMNPAQFVAQELIRIHQDNKAQPGKYTAWWAAANAMGLSDDQIRVAINTPLATLKSARDSMNKDATSMGYSGKVAAAWQAFDIQLSKARIQIGSAFITGLAPIMPQLTTLSREFSGFIVGLEKSGEVKQWVGELVGGLKEFDAWLKTPAFGKDLALVEAKAKSFANALGIVADDTIAVAKWIEAHAPKSLNLKDMKAGAIAGAVTGLIAGGPAGAVVGAVAGATAGYLANHPLTFGNPQNPLNLRSAPNAGSVTATNAGKFAAFHSDADGYKAAAWQLGRYPAEHHADTIRSIIPIWAPPSDHNNDARYIADVAKWSGLKPGQKIDFHNQDQVSRLIAAMAREESGKRITPTQVRNEIASSKWMPVPHPAALTAARRIADHADGGWSDVARVLKRLRTARSNVHVTVHSPAGSQVFVSANSAAGGV